MKRLRQLSNFVLIVMALAFCASVPAQQPLLKQVQTIPLDDVEGRFDHFAIDVRAKRLYIAALGNNSLEVIDTEAGKRIKSISGLREPTGVRVLSDGKVVVASGGDGKLRAYDKDLKLVATLDQLDDADNVRLGAQGKLVFVGYASGAIAIIDPQATRKIGQIKLDGHPEAFQLESVGSRIFVNVPTAKQIAVLDRNARSTLAKWPLADAQANFPMALDEASHRLFVGCRKPAKLLVLDIDSGKVVSSIDCCGDTDDLYFDRDAKRIYISGGEGFVSVIGQSDADHYTLLDRIPTAAGARTSIFVPETRLLYLAVPHRGEQKAELRVYQAVKPAPG